MYFKYDNIYEYRLGLAGGERLGPFQLTGVCLDRLAAGSVAGPIRGFLDRQGKSADIHLLGVGVSKVPHARFWHPQPHEKGLGLGSNRSGCPNRIEAVTHSGASS